MLISDFMHSKSKSTVINEVENVAKLHESVPRWNVDNFSVSNKDKNAVPALPKKRRTLAVQSSEEE